MSEEEEKTPFMEHLTELRDRLIRSSIAVGVGFIIAYCFKERLFDFLTAPLIIALGPDSKMIYTSLPEAFLTYIKVSLLTGIAMATPVLFYEFWMFVSPGLYRNERRFFVPVVIISVFFFFIGSSFGYFFVFPFGFKFFLGFSSETIQAMPSMKEYLGFASKMLLAFGFIFELPLVLTFMGRMGLVSVDFLKKNRKYAILIIFIVAAILTPPDVITQCMMAIPLIILYEISIFGVMFFQKKSPADEDENNDDDDKDQDHEDQDEKEDK